MLLPGTFYKKTDCHLIGVGCTWKNKCRMFASLFSCRIRYEDENKYEQSIAVMWRRDAEQ